MNRTAQSLIAAGLVLSSPSLASRRPVTAEDLKPVSNSSIPDDNVRFYEKTLAPLFGEGVTINFLNASQITGVLSEVSKTANSELFPGAKRLEKPIIYYKETSGAEEVRLRVISVKASESKFLANTVTTGSILPKAPQEYSITEGTIIRFSPTEETTTKPLSLWSLQIGSGKDPNKKAFATAMMGALSKAEDNAADQIAQFVTHGTTLPTQGTSLAEEFIRDALHLIQYTKPASSKEGNWNTLAFTVTGADSRNKTYAWTSAGLQQEDGAMSSQSFLQHIRGKKVSVNPESQRALKQLSEGGTVTIGQKSQPVSLSSPALKGLKKAGFSGQMSQIKTPATGTFTVTVRSLQFNPA